MEKLAEFAVIVVLAVALTANLDKFTLQVQLATLKVLKESQSSNWGSPRFFSSKQK